jgi:signal transduction histidine kinase
MPRTTGSGSIRGLHQVFGDLRVRPKLIVLHNVFFLFLTSAVYFSLIPGIERRTAEAHARESALLEQIFARGGDLTSLAKSSRYEVTAGSAAELGITGPVRDWLDARPGSVWQEPGESLLLYRKDPAGDRYARLLVPAEFYSGVVSDAKLSLFLVLGGVYIMAVLALELIIMPHYVYGPIRLTLAADQASLRNDRAGEIISEDLIPGDEIGDIMRSRNRTVAQVRVQQGDLERALARLEDLNRDLQRKNEELEAAKTTMAAQDRLASLGLLSASVAHELNTPLAVLHGSIEQLCETVEDPATQQRLQRMQRVTERLRQISVTLLDFSRMPREETAPVPIRRLVDEAWGLVGFDLRAGQVHYVNEVPDDLRVQGNHDRLMQVFVNLLRNALYAVESRGRIAVHSRCENSNGQRWVYIVVDDNGPGIPEEVLPSIFEAFVTSRLDSRGTGLGLTVAKGIVTQHNGEITASNHAAGGARLEVRLPAAAERADA